MTQAHPAAAAAGGVGGPPLSSRQLWLAAIVLAAANFVVVLDMSIANVCVPGIAGQLGTATSQATWVITSYCVAEAISVPLTGWLAIRFGAVRVFSVAMGLFGIASLLCGLAPTLGFLIAARILQGCAAGPLMPLSQTLLLRIFPPRMASAALGLWAMTTLIAPVLGPIAGGWICDQYSWPVIFLINIPLAVGCALVAWTLLRRYELAQRRSPVDKVGLVLLVVWVGALQLMLDKGRSLDWFASPTIIALAVVAVLGLAAFLIWELHEAHPIVELRVFRHRGFTMSVLSISLAFGAFFAMNVLTPLWLQGFMGYTATQSGWVVVWSGVFALLVAPLAVWLSGKRDPRWLVSTGVLWLGGVTFWRAMASTDMAYWDIALPLMLTGLALPFFFIAASGLALASVQRHEMESAAGMMNFLRTLSGAAAVSIMHTAWENRIIHAHAELVGLTDRGGQMLRQLEQEGLSAQAALHALAQLLEGQSVMLATNQQMLVIALCFAVTAGVIWLAPRPGRALGPIATRQAQFTPAGGAGQQLSQGPPPGPTQPGSASSACQSRASAT